MRPHPKRTSTNTRSPRAWGTCDRSGFITNHEKMAWQYDWRGTQLVNLRVLVTPDMLDKPQRQLGTIILPPDPVGLLNARPEQYSMEEGSAFALVQHAVASSSGKSSVSVTLPHRPIQGNMIIAGAILVSGAAGGVTVSDGLNSYTATPSGVNVAAGAGLCIFYLPDAPANAGGTITVKAGNVLTTMEVFAAEFSGAVAVAPFETEAFATGTGTQINMPTVTTNFSDLLFAIIRCTTGHLGSANAPWTVLDNISDGSAYAFQSVSGTQAANFIQTSSVVHAQPRPGALYFGNPLVNMIQYSVPTPAVVGTTWDCQIAAFKSWGPMG